MDQIEFKPWPKIPRKKARIIITEKIDGTNSCIIIKDKRIVGAQSRNRLLSLEDDNHGFYKWVLDNKEPLESMGDGYHYGEWVGPGINGNRHVLNEKRLYLFNALRWGDHNLPKLCFSVPVIYDGDGHEGIVRESMDKILKDRDYLPEGVVAFYPSTKQMVKYTFENITGKWNGPE